MAPNLTHITFGISLGLVLFARTGLAAEPAEGEEETEDTELEADSVETRVGD